MFGLFKNKDYKQKAFFTFCPRPIFRLDPSRNAQKIHWKSQDIGDPHGYDKYDKLNAEHASVLFKEVQSVLEKNKSILDLGCNCGYMLDGLKKIGYKNLSGIDICKNAIEYGKKKFDLAGVELTVGSQEEVLPRLVSQKRIFDLVYSCGASVSLVHPSFDVIRHICRLSHKYVIMVNEDSLGFPYPRLWEYEFNRNGFAMVKYLMPYDGSVLTAGREDGRSLAVYQRVRGI
jgi:SAM-dependent methyltransferase